MKKLLSCYVMRHNIAQTSILIFPLHLSVCYVKLIILINLVFF